MQQEYTDINNALNEYFRLKSKFEDDNKIALKKITNNTTLSKKEKRAEFLKLKPKCVNCKRHSHIGTNFKIIFNKSSENIDEYKTYKATCGDLVNPCNLNIEINIGSNEPLDQLMKGIRLEILETKNIVINDKNKLLFGIIDTESAIEKFEANKSYINELTSIYENYLDKWNATIENTDKQHELNELLMQSYNYISDIKKCIKNMEESNNNKYATDAVNIYNNNLKPILDKIRGLKYSMNFAFKDQQNVCRLKQQTYTISDMLVSSYDANVQSFNVGLKNTSVKQTKQPQLVIETSSSEAEFNEG